MPLLRRSPYMTWSKPSVTTSGSNKLFSRANQEESERLVERREKEKRNALIQGQIGVRDWDLGRLPKRTPCLICKVVNSASIHSNFLDSKTSQLILPLKASAPRSSQATLTEHFVFGYHRSYSLKFAWQKRPPYSTPGILSLSQHVLQRRFRAQACCVST